MSSQTSSLRSFALAAPIILVWGVGITVPANAAPARTANCLAAPNSPTPKGMHWYYHTDRVRRRKCWFLRALHQRTQHTTGHRFSAIHAETVKKSESGSAVAHVSTKEGIAAPPLPPLASQRAQVSATREVKTPEFVRQRVQDAAPSAPADAVPQAGAAWSAEASPLAKAPASNFAWPEPPATAPVATPQPASVPRDARAAAVPAKAEAPPTRPIKSTSQFPTTAAAVGNAASAANFGKMAAQTASSSAQPFLELLLVVMFGLTAAGTLYRLVIKLGGMGGPRVIVSRADADWNDDWHRQGRQGDRWQHAPMRERGNEPAHQPAQDSVHGHGAFIQDARLSLVPAAGDVRLHQPYPVIGRRPSVVRRESGTTPTAETEANDERQNNLMQLIRDLDQSLQTRRGT